jgi:multicomponent Na+:H+ antiporter subunit A
MAQDLLLLFIFWDLTSIASYYLIGYDREKEMARSSALMALLVTGITAILFLIGALLLYSEWGTFSLPELITRAQAGETLSAACALMAVAALAKSAQAPFHFWLPRAMVAPTPVSAYLHSAAMVAAGVFLLGRLHPLLQRGGYLLDGLMWLGWLSIAIGGVMALTRDRLKEVLAYSTIAQYGYVAVMLGLGSRLGAAAASFYVIAHGLLKSALFLTAGAVTEATGEDCLSRVRGLGRSTPALAAASGVAAAGLAGLPLTIGFFKDEGFFKATLERGWIFVAFATLAAALTLAYAWRWWSGVFLGEGDRELHPIPARMTAAVAALGLLALLGDMFVAPFTRLAEAAGMSTFGAPTPIHFAYHLDARPENLMALAAYALGALLVISRPAWVGAAVAVAQAGRRLGPERLYYASLRGLHHAAMRLHRIEVYDLRNRIVTILVPTAALLGAGVLATPTENAFRVGGLGQADLPLLIALSITTLGALAAVWSRGHIFLSLALSSVNAGLIAVFALLEAPDVALVMALISSISTLLFLGTLALFPRAVLRREERLPLRPGLRRRNRVFGLISGGGALIVAWSVLSQPALHRSVAETQARLTPEAHAGDVVTAILADFRGLDTLGEITVIALAMLGAVSLLSERRTE